MKINVKETIATFVMVDLVDCKVFEETRSFVGTHDEKSLIKLYSELANYSEDIQIVKVKYTEIVSNSIELKDEAFYISAIPAVVYNTKIHGKAHSKRTLNIKNIKVYYANTDTMQVETEIIDVVNKKTSQDIIKYLNERTDLLENVYFVKYDVISEINDEYILPHNRIIR